MPRRRQAFNAPPPLRARAGYERRPTAGVVCTWGDHGGVPPHAGAADAFRPLEGCLSLLLQLLGSCGGGAARPLHAAGCWEALKEVGVGFVGGRLPELAEEAHAAMASHCRVSGERGLSVVAGPSTLAQAPSGDAVLGSGRGAGLRQDGSA